MLFRSSILVIALFTAAPAAPASPQDQAASRAEAAVLAEGWTLLARGDAAGAALRASKVLGQNQNSTAAVALAVESGIVSGGSSGGLTAYEKWLGSRKVDDAYVLRRVARALLIEASGQKPNTTARLDALKALAADGDSAAAAALEQALLSNRFNETRALASMGDDRAVKNLIAQLGSMPGSKTAIIEALADSGNKLAVPPLRTLLSDQNDINRAAAADALGRLEATDAIPQLKALLKDQIFAVKLKAAGALFRLNDSSGLPFLTEAAASEHGAIRVAAARELAAQPDVGWQAMVRGLTGDPDPVVRIEAARLIAPYDQPLAKSVLDNLMRDSNIGIREAASGVLVERVASDFATLRTLMHSGDLTVRVKAAGRILELTR
jgi:HEAT repeat protein